MENITAGQLAECLKRTDIAFCKKETRLDNNDWDYLSKGHYLTIARQILDKPKSILYQLKRSDLVACKKETIFGDKLFHSLTKKDYETIAKQIEKNIIDLKSK